MKSKFWWEYSDFFELVFTIIQNRFFFFNAHIDTKWQNNPARLEKFTLYLDPVCVAQQESLALRYFNWSELIFFFFVLAVEKAQGSVSDSGFYWTLKYIFFLITWDRHDESI